MGTLFPCLLSHWAAVKLSFYLFQRRNLLTRRNLQSNLPLFFHVLSKKLFSFITPGAIFFKSFYTEAKLHFATCKKIGSKNEKGGTR